MREVEAELTRLKTQAMVEWRERTTRTERLLEVRLTPVSSNRRSKLIEGD